jgi:transposase-like protein
MSDSDHPTTSIIKSDRTGRTRYAQQYKQEVLAAYEASSLSAPQFAAQCGIKYPTFASWLAAGKRDGRSATAANRPTFLLAEVAASPEATSAVLEVRLPCGAVVRVPSRDQLPLLVELLRQLA